MNLDDLFEKGVTPKDGEYAGQRFRVVSINKDGASVREWDTNKFASDLKHGSYSVWTPPPTVLNDPHMDVTWGELKKAVEQAKLPDDTQIYVGRLFALYGATVTLAEVDKKKALIFY